MTLKLTCPACAAAFASGDDVRGKKTSCPNCGASLIVTSAGVAKGNERPRPALAQFALALGWNPLWLLLTGLLLLLLGGLVGHLLTRGTTDEHKPVAENNSDQPPPRRDAGDGSLTKLSPPPLTETPKLGPAKVRHWEHKVATLQPVVLPYLNDSMTKQADAVTDYFNQLAREGWEYHSPLGAATLGSVYQLGYVIFKRPKR